MKINKIIEIDMFDNKYDKIYDNTTKGKLMDNKLLKGKSGVGFDEIYSKITLILGDYTTSAYKIELIQKYLNDCQARMIGGE